MTWLRDAWLWLHDGVRVSFWPGYATPDMVPRIAARDLARRGRVAVAQFAYTLAVAASKGQTQAFVCPMLTGDDTIDAIAKAYRERGYTVQTIPWQRGDNAAYRDSRGNMTSISWGARCGECGNG